VGEEFDRIAEETAEFGREEDGAYRYEKPL
jgi:hypothetical protein